MALEDRFYKKRAVASIDFYVYGDDEEELISKAKYIAAQLDTKHDNKATVLEVGTQPFGTTDYKIIYTKNEQ